MSNKIKLVFNEKQIELLKNSIDINVVSLITSKLNTKLKILTEAAHSADKNRNRKQKILLQNNRSLISVAEEFRERLIKDCTREEKIFKIYLELNNIKFEFQKIIYNRNKSFYIVDFYLPEYDVIYEIDGGYHLPWKQKIKDNNRSKDLLNLSFKNIRRIKNENVEKYSDSDIKYMLKNYIKVK